MGVSNYTGVLKFISNDAYNLIIDQAPTATLLAIAPETAEAGVRLVKSTGFSSCFSGCDMNSYLGCSISFDYRTGFTYVPGTVCIMGVDS
jgi:hypothetical protein